MLVDRQLLLGVGVGLLLAATLSALGGGRERPLSEVEIIKRAKALGMGFPGEQRLALNGASEGRPTTPATKPAAPRTPPPKPAAPGPSTVTVVVPPGATAGEVARLLTVKSLIADEGEFLRLAEARQAESRFLPGTYRFRSDVTVKSLISALLTGPKPE